MKCPSGRGLWWPMSHAGQVPRDRIIVNATIVNMADCRVDFLRLILPISFARQAKGQPGRNVRKHDDEQSFNAHTSILLSAWVVQSCGWAEYVRLPHQLEEFQFLLNHVRHDCFIS